MGHDVVVVGAGSAGAVLAARLAQDGHRRVALIEAGPDYPDLDTLPDDLKYGHATGAELVASEVHNWHYVARATDDNPAMEVPRGRVTGGSSAINGQILLRGIPEDFDGWRDAGNEGWGFADVLPYLRALESDEDYGETATHGGAGPIGVRRYAESTWLPGQRAFHQACLDAGFPACPDHNAPDSTGVGPYPLNNPGEIRVSTALAYLPLVRDRPNFTLLADTTARRVVFSGTRAVGVEVDRNGERSVIEGDEIVLSAGAIGSPQLLLCSGVGPADQLTPLGIDVVCELSGVGCHLRDHLTAPIVWAVAPDRVVPPPAPLVQVLLRYTADGSPLRNDMWITALSLGPVFGLVPGIHGPVGEGDLSITSADVAVHPRLDYRYLTEEDDRRRLREGVRLALELAGSSVFDGLLTARVAPADGELADDAAIDAWLRHAATTSHHVCGTCRMGPAWDHDAVVDAHARVHGVDRLRVVDVSIVPTIPRANTNSVAIMIGERVAALMGAGETSSGARDELV